MLKNFIKALGGPEAVAKAIAGMNPPKGPPSDRAVYQWHYDGTVPQRWCYFVAKIAKKKKVTDVPPEVRSFM